MGYVGVVGCEEAVDGGGGNLTPLKAVPGGVGNLTPPKAVDTWKQEQALLSRETTSQASPHRLAKDGRPVVWFAATGFSRNEEQKTKAKEKKPKKQKPPKQKTRKQ